MMADPNRIDISLSLLPGESEVVIDDLINALKTNTEAVQALLRGDEYAPVQDVMARQSVTASQDRPIDVNIVSVSPHASFATPTPDVDRTKEKLGAVAATNPPGWQPPGEEPTKEMDNASQSTIEDPEDTAKITDLPDKKIREMLAEQHGWGRIRRTTEALLARNEPETEEEVERGYGSINKRKTIDDIRETAMTYGVLRGFHHSTDSEVDQLKRSFTPENLVNVGVELGGGAPTTNYGLGPIFGTENVLPGTAYIEAAKGILGIGGKDDAASAKGARVEAASAVDSAASGYLNQEQARVLSHSAIGHGWGEDEADRDREAYGRLRKRAGGGLQGLSAKEYGDLTENIRRDAASSMKELDDALLDMPEAAEAARMGLDEFREASVQYAESLKSQGATFGRAISAGGDFSTITGMAPTVGQALRQAPIVQGHLAGQGLLPQMQGLASETQLTGIATEQAKNMFDMFRPGMTDTVEETAAGTAVTATADDKAMAMVASQLGVPVGQVERLLNLDDNDTADKRGEAITNIVGYGQQVEDIEKNFTGEDLSKARRGMRTGVGAPESAITRPEIIESLREAGVDEESLETLNKTTTATKFQHYARKALARVTSGETEKAAPDEKTINEVIVEVRPTGALEKLLTTKEIKSESHKRATKERNRGRGSYNHNNPDGDPPDSAWDTILDALPLTGGRFGG